MSKTLVTYHSETGNTLRVAEAIYEAITDTKEIKPISEVPSLEAYALVFIGFPIHSHSIRPKVQAFLKKIPENKKIALFSTHGALTGSKLSREAIEQACVTASKAQVLGTFSCRGKVPYSVLEGLGQKPEHRAWAEMAASARTHPNETDLQEAGVFAKWIRDLSLAKK